MAIETLNIEDLDRNGLQTRVALDEATVVEYSEAMRGKAHFPPVTAFCDGAKIYLADGFHRVEATLRCGLKKIKADVREGTFADALRHALGANANHGLRRTNADKKRCLQLAWENRRELFGRDDADPSAEIMADVCGVTKRWVELNMRQLIQLPNDSVVENTKTSQNAIPPPQRRVFGKDGKTRTIKMKPPTLALPTRALPTRDDPNRAMNVAAHNQPTRPVQTLDEYGTTGTNVTTGGRCAYADKDGFCHNKECQGGGFECCHCDGFTPVKRGYNVGTDGKIHADGVELDRFGVEIPDEIVGAFTSADLEEFISDVLKIKTRIKAAIENKNIALAAVSQRALIELDNAYHELKAARPYCVCRMCQGHGCGACRSTGFQTEDQYERNEKQFKA